MKKVVTLCVFFYQNALNFLVFGYSWCFMSTLFKYLRYKVSAIRNRLFGELIIKLKCLRVCKRTFRVFRYYFICAEIRRSVVPEIKKNSLIRKNAQSHSSHNEKSACSGVYGQHSSPLSQSKILERFIKRLCTNTLNRIVC